jgi:hypothetical protein
MWSDAARAHQHSATQPYRYTQPAPIHQHHPASITDTCATTTYKHEGATATITHPAASAYGNAQTRPNSDTGSVRTSSRNCAANEYAGDKPYYGHTRGY